MRMEKKEIIAESGHSREPSIYQTFNSTDFLSRADKFEEYQRCSQF